MLFPSLPPVLTHTYNSEAPFLANLCELPGDKAEVVLNRIRTSGRRCIKPNYLRRRRYTELRLMEGRTRILGTTPLERPVYFFLGDFADGLDPSRPCSLVIPLDAFSADILTFTTGYGRKSLPAISQISISIGACMPRKEHRRVHRVPATGGVSHHSSQQACC